MFTFRLLSKYEFSFKLRLVPSVLYCVRWSRWGMRGCAHARVTMGCFSRGGCRIGGGWTERSSTRSRGGLRAGDCLDAEGDGYGARRSSSGGSEQAVASQIDELLAGVDLGISAGIVGVVLGVFGEIPSLGLDTPATILAFATLGATALSRGAAVDTVQDQCSRRSAAIALALL